MKNTQLSSGVKQDFWKQMVLGDLNDPVSSIIRRAYLDLNRTLHGINPENYLVGKKYIQDFLQNLSSKPINSQNDFDVFHQRASLELREKMRDTGYNDFFIGHSQKWINMTLKYYSAFCEYHDTAILKHYPYFHFPVDNIVMDFLKKEFSIKQLNCPWSKLDEYSAYLAYQKELRKRISIPVLSYEFEIFNRVNRNKIGYKNLNHYDHYEYCKYHQIPWIQISKKDSFNKIEADLITVDINAVYNKSLVDVYSPIYKKYCETSLIPKKEIKLIGGSRNLIITVQKDDSENIADELFNFLSEFIKKERIQ